MLSLPNRKRERRTINKLKKKKLKQAQLLMQKPRIKPPRMPKSFKSKSQKPQSKVKMPNLLKKMRKTPALTTELFKIKLEPIKIKSKTR